MTENQTVGRGARFLIVAAAAFIVLFGFKQAAEVVAPILLAGMLAILFAGPIRRLRGWRIPNGAAVLVVMLGATTALVWLVAALSSSVADFAQRLPEYEQRLDQLEGDVSWWLSRSGQAEDIKGLLDSVDSGALFKLIAGTALDTLNKIGNVMVLVMILMFMLFEASGLPDRVRRALGGSQEKLAVVLDAGAQVSRYIAIKTWISLATGILVGVLNIILGNDFPFMWAVVAFLFNFIPNIGSAIAAVPAVLLLLILQGFAPAAGLAAGYIVINIVIGTVIEPRIMGRKLGLSTLVVFLSLIIWTWVLGPVGMLLAVPMTVILKIALEQTDDLRPFAVLLGPDEDPGDPAK